MHVSLSNDSLNKAMDDPIRPFDEQPTFTELRVPRRSRERERRYSAPLNASGERKSAIRDSVGSLDYLSESQGETCVDSIAMCFESVFISLEYAAW